MTVLMTGASGRTYLGRYHERTPRGVVFRDVAVFDPTTENGGGVEDWLERQRRFGIHAAHKALVVAEAEIGPIARFLAD